MNSELTNEQDECDQTGLIAVVPSFNQMLFGHLGSNLQKLIGLSSRLFIGGCRTNIDSQWCYLGIVHHIATFTTLRTVLLDLHGLLSLEVLRHLSHSENRKAMNVHLDQSYGFS